MVILISKGISMTYHMNKPCFMHKNKTLTTIALQNYVGYLPFEDRILLQSQFINNPQYKKEFADRLLEIVIVLDSLFFEGDTLDSIKCSINKLRLRERSSNIYIIDMYKNIVSTLLSDIESGMDKENMDEQLELIELILQDCPIYEDMKDIFAIHD